MIIDTDKVRGAETTPHHIVLKMLVISTTLTAVAMAAIAMVH